MMNTKKKTETADGPPDDGAARKWAIKEWHRIHFGRAGPIYTKSSGSLSS